MLSLDAVVSNFQSSGKANRVSYGASVSLVLLFALETNWACTGSVGKVGFVRVGLGG